MTKDLPSDPRYRRTMARLEEMKRKAESGSVYWFARDVQAVLAYESWAKFTPVINRASASMVSNEINPSHHIVRTGKMLGLGSGAKRRVEEYFLSRACYLIAMNGDPSKPEVAAAQAYFAISTRMLELQEALSDDEKRLEQREKVKESFKAVSGAAQAAGVPNNKQALFHDARYQGLYKMSARDVKSSKGIGVKENIFDRMGVLELSANDFQMNLAAETIENEGIRGEHHAIRKNKEVAIKVRRTMIDSGSRPPEELPAAEPITEVKKRIKASPEQPKISGS